MCEKHYQMYRTVKNFGGKKVWQNSVFETLAKNFGESKACPYF